MHGEESGCTPFNRPDRIRAALLSGGNKPSEEQRRHIKRAGDEDVRPRKCAAAGLERKALNAADGKEGEFKESIKGTSGPGEIANKGLSPSRSTEMLPQSATP